MLLWRPVAWPVRLATFLFIVTTAIPDAATAFTIERVRSDTGVEAWLVEDYTNPIVTVAASFNGGAVQDPVGMAGMASLMSTLFDEGAGSLDSEAFQAKIDALGIKLRFSDDRDRFTARLQTLKTDSEEAFELMRMSLTDLRFEEDSIARMRDALSARLLRRENRPRTRAGIALRTSLFGTHPYARSLDGTRDGLSSIDRGDLTDHFARLFARDNVKVAVVGAISAGETRAMLEKVFGGLPQSAQLSPIPEVKPNFGEEIVIEENTPQATVILAYPAVSRHSDEFFAAYLMNHILGGGTFSSRLYEEVREKRGLAYSIGSDIENYERASFLTIGTATHPERVDEAIGIIRSEVERIAREGPTLQELNAAKRYVIGAYAINNLDTSENIARALVAMQEEELGIDYLETRVSDINSVTLEEVKAIARKLLSVNPTQIVVRPPKA